MTAKAVREGYGTPADISLMVKLHEFKGCNEKGKTLPGLTKMEMHDLIEDFKVDDDQKVEENTGWYNN